jgi:endonuclease III
MSVITEVLARLPGKFSKELDIDVKAGAAERQKWFLAAILYGAPISGALATRTFRVFAERGVLTPQAILAQTWDNLVVILDEGGYTRYDFKTATKLLRVMEALQESYEGDLERLAADARDYHDMERRLCELAPGIGPTTVNIYLRELRGIWPQANPPLSPFAHLASEHLQLIALNLDPFASLAALQEKWDAESVAGGDFADLEAALVRLGRDYCRKPDRPNCPMGPFCGRGRIKSE